MKSRIALIALALFAAVLLFSACHGSRLNLDPEAGQALIGFSKKMVVKFDTLTAQFAAAKSSREAARVLQVLPGAMSHLYSEAKALQAQYKKQNFADFHKAAGRRSTSEARVSLEESVSTLKAVNVSEEDGKAVAKIATAVKNLLKGAEKADADRLLADVVASSAVLKKKSDKKLGSAVAKVEAASRFLVETVLVLNIKAGATRLQAAMKKLNEQYMKLEKKYKDDAVYQAEIKKMKEAMKKVK